MNSLIVFFRTLFGILLPKNRFGDKIYSFINFVFKLRRIPTNKMIFNDVIYRIKIGDEILNPLRVFVTDKEYGKIYLKSIVAEDYIIPTIKIFYNFNEIANYDFPDICCIKPTHLSGECILKTQDVKINYEKIKKWFFTNHYIRSREANYKILKPKVIVEPVVFNNFNINDYKFFCYKGIPKLIQVDINRYIDDGKKHRRQYFNTRWEKQNFSILYPQYEGDINKPLNLDHMLLVVTKLSKSTNLDFIRIDIFTDNQKIFIGEITNLHDGAAGQFYPASAEALCSKIIFS